MLFRWHYAWLLRVIVSHLHYHFLQDVTEALQGSDVLGETSLFTHFTLFHLECIFTLCRLRHFYTQHLKLIVPNMASCCVSLWGCDTVLSSSHNLLFVKKQLYLWVELMHQPVLCSETQTCTHTGVTPTLSRINGRRANMCFRMQMFVFQSLAINMIRSTPENCGAVAFKGQQPIRALFVGGQNQSAAPWWHDSFHFTIVHIPASSLRHKQLIKFGPGREVTEHINVFYDIRL